MSYRLPEALQTDDDTRALAFLREYYGRDGGSAYTGSYFDGWGGQQDPDRFTAEDVVAVTFLSVVVPPMAAHRLLHTEAERFCRLLRDIGPDRDFAQEAEPVHRDWPGWRLETALRELSGVGRTIATKLCARKRPGLLPIYDSVVGEVTSAQSWQWEPLRQVLRADDGALQTRLLGLRDAAGLDASVSALRVYDVIAWMEGKKRGVQPTDPDDQLGAAVTGS
ncbi:hypothetical protein SAMN05660464_0016 [Geodermatophilus dictyosporus]|uniref:Uncharacterized protein n=1 Tax=Geodermatophilus dictyosporus TaxID=1523247 RepID=A0A1I5U1P2_9ACTN|nr:DUF6308 family protein [Geodermatophilus dictyosporus]SFP89220.1 hypothetical protein SAMN05660464_0016 [Geodermatophilus dictyosporus]